MTVAASISDAASRQVAKAALGDHRRACGGRARVPAPAALARVAVAQGPRRGVCVSAAVDSRQPVARQLRLRADRRRRCRGISGTASRLPLLATVLTLAAGIPAGVRPVARAVCRPRPADGDAAGRADALAGGAAAAALRARRAARARRHARSGWCSRTRRFRCRSRPGC